MKEANEECLNQFQIQNFMKMAKLTEGLYIQHMQSIKEKEPVQDVPIQTGII